MIVGTHHETTVLVSRLKRHLVHLLAAIFILLTALFCFHDLGRLPLAEWDESTNGRVVSQSLRSGNPLDLRLDGQPFFEKTPLWYYATEVSVSLFGQSNWSLRLVGALSSFLLILGVALIGWRLWGWRSGLLAGAMLLATPHLWVRNVTGYFSTHTLRSADVDSLLMLCVLASWAATVGFVRRGTVRYLVLSGLFAGLAVMTKGPVGLLPLIILGVCLLGVPRGAINRVSTIKSVFVLVGAVLLVALPWYLWMFVRYGWPFVDQHIGYHLLGRIGTTLENHSEHWWFYLKLLADPQVFPGFTLLVYATYLTERARRWREDYASASLLGLILALVVLNMLVQTRLAWYVLPVYPFAALLVGGMVRRRE